MEIVFGFFCQKHESSSLHIGNKVALVPIAHSVVLKESYLDMNYLLDALCYNLHQWKICGVI